MTQEQNEKLREQVARALDLITRLSKKVETFKEEVTLPEERMINYDRYNTAMRNFNASMDVFAKTYNLTHGEMKYLVSEMLNLMKITELPDHLNLNEISEHDGQ